MTNKEILVRIIQWASIGLWSTMIGMTLTSIITDETERACKRRYY